MSADTAVLNAVQKLLTIPDDYNEMEAELNKISVPQDPLPVHISQALVQLDVLHQKTYPYAVRAKVAYDNASSLLDEVMMSKGKGTNPTAMKADAARQAQNYLLDDIAVNLFELERATRTRHRYYDGLMQAIAQKHSRLITLIGAHNLEIKLIT